MKQSTFIMFKPDTIERNLTSELLAIFLDHGYKVLRSKEVLVDEKLILKHYEDVIKAVNADYFKNAILKVFVGKKVWVYELSKDTDQDVIHQVRELVGATDPLLADPESIRGRYGNDSKAVAMREKRMLMNLIHASDSKESVEKEMKLWFEHK
jgi:nucleoside-diphosphate kinase